MSSSSLISEDLQGRHEVEMVQCVVTVCHRHRHSLKLEAVLATLEDLSKAAHISRRPGYFCVPLLTEIYEDTSGPQQSQPVACIQPFIQLGIINHYPNYCGETTH